MKDSGLKNKKSLESIEKVLHLYKEEIHRLKETFLKINKEVFSQVLLLQYIITDITSSYIALDGDVVKKDNLELIITSDDVTARVDGHNVGRLNTTNEIAIMNCLFVIASSQIYIRTLVHLFRESLEFSNRRLILNALEDTVSLSNSVLGKIHL